jgi:Glycosyl transferase family 2
VAAIARDRVGADRVLVVEYSFDPRNTSPLGTVSPDREGWCTFTEGAEPVEGASAAGRAVTVYSGARQPKASWPDVAKRHEGVIVSPLHHSSERAFAEHVLAMAASGVVVAHAHDPLVDRLLPDATIRLDELGVAPAVSGFDRRRTAARARRLAFHNHQRIHRFEQILARLDIPTKPNPRVSVLLPTRRPELVPSAVAAVAAQSYPDIELVLVAHGFDPAVASTALAEADIEGKVVEVPASRSFGEALNRGLAVATGSLIAKMDDDDIYGSGHVEDLVVMFEAVGADIIGRAPDFVYLAQRDETLEVDTGLAMTETWHVAGPTMMLKRSIATSLLFEHRRHAVDQTLYDRAAAAGLRIVALDGFDFVLFRGHGDHTWITADENFLDAAVTRWNGLERSATMIGTERGHPASAD